MIECKPPNALVVADMDSEALGLCAVPFCIQRHSGATITVKLAANFAVFCPTFSLGGLRVSIISVVRLLPVHLGPQLSLP